MKIEIVPSEPGHVPILVRNLREADRREMTCLGHLPRRAVWRTYKQAVMRRTAFVNGELAAMWGVCGGFADRTAVPWLLTTPAAEVPGPRVFVETATEELEKMLQAFGHLQNYVDASYTRAVRLLKVLGFTIHNPEPLAPTGALFRRFELKRA